MLQDLAARTLRQIDHAVEEVQEGLHPRFGLGVKRAVVVRPDIVRDPDEPRPAQPLRGREGRELQAALNPAAAGGAVEESRRPMEHHGIPPQQRRSRPGEIVDDEALLLQGLGEQDREGVGVPGMEGRRERQAQRRTAARQAHLLLKSRHRLPPSLSPTAPLVSPTAIPAGGNRAARPRKD